jgi:PEP-CTERM motif
LAVNNGFLTYDDLFWPGGSPQTATDYPIGGGFLDIYGLLFDIGDGRVVNFWSNGDSGSGVDYGLAVATSAISLDYVSGGVTVPEPGSLALLGAGIALLSTIRRRTRRADSIRSVPCARFI